MVNRRAFLRHTALGLTAAAAGSRWSMLLATPLGLPIGLELYTVRDQLAKDLHGTMKKVADVGYKEVEFFDFYGKTASDIRQLLKDTGLRAPSAHYKTPDMKSGWQKRIDYAKEVGIPYMGLAWLDPSERQSLDDYKRLAELENQVGEQCRKAGVRFAHHNHNFEFKTFDGLIAYDELLRLTDPKLVKLEMDCYWVTRAGKDPVEYFNRYPGRIHLLHIKDRKPGYAPSTEQDVKPGPFTEVGRGVIDWKRIFAAAPKGGVKHYYVEQDFTDRPPFESIKISYDYLKNLKA
jgi:sugar phosphate isomerase/epimerase